MTEANEARTEGVVYEVEAGRKVSVGAPSLLAMPNGRLLAGFDLTGPDAKGLPGQKGHDKVRNRWVQTKVFSSVDGGGTWSSVATLGVRCGRMFRDGGDLWLLGELNGALWLARSPDGGGSWSAPASLGAEEGYTGAMTRPLKVGETWFFAAWREGEWVLWKAAAGTNLSAKKAWQRCGGTAGGAGEALLKAGAAGAGVPAAGVAPGWGGGGAMVELPEGHPWGSGAAAVFAAKAGRAGWALALRCGEDGKWAGLGGGGAPWGWVRWPGGHAAFSVVREGGEWWCAGNALAGDAPRWGRGVHEEARLTRLDVWRSRDGESWRCAGTLCEGRGQGAAAVRRDPSLAAAANGQLWMACRAGTAGSRNARDMGQIRWAKGPVAR